MGLNAEGYDRRMEVVHDIIREHGLEATEVTTVEYDDNGPCYFNNYIFKVSLSSPATSETFSGKTQPCTVAAPAGGISTVIVRLSNPRAEGMNDTNRVQNEVAAMHLAREAISQLSDEYVDIVPAVYAWRAGDVSKFPDEKAFGWTLMEFKLGSPMDGMFAAMSLEDKKVAVGKIASIFSALQGVKLPANVTRYGGMTIDADGEIVGGEPTLAHGGPWAEYVDEWKGKLAMNLMDADEAELIRGWRGNGVRERIDRFVEEKMGDVIRGAGLEGAKLGLVHSDFSMNNMLYDPKTNRITALLDFDWATISNPAQEFLTSFYDLAGRPNSCAPSLKAAVLSGNFDLGAPEPSETKDLEEWEVARAWDVALREQGALRPSDVKGMEALGQLSEFSGLLSPFLLSHPAWMRRRSSEEEIVEKRRVAEEELVKALEGYGV